MKILVTGHDGYIGSVLVEKLLERGYEVRGFDTYFFQSNLYPQARTPTEAVNKDVRDVDAEDLEGVDAIVHLAALSNDPMGELDRGLTLRINFEASVRLARLAKQMGIQRFLFASSCSMYGTSSGQTVNEDAPFNPLTAYALSKVKTEEALSQLADGTFSPTYLRNATAYGLSPKLRFDLVLNNLIGWAMTTGQINVMSDGTPWRPLVHVEDIADAFIAALEAPIQTVHNQTFNVGQDFENYQVRHIAEAVRRVVPGSQVTFADDPGPDARSYRVDFTKIHRALRAYQPSWTVERGAQQLYDALTTRGITQGDFLGPAFVRIEQIKRLLSTRELYSDLRWRHPIRQEALSGSAVESTKSGGQTPRQAGVGI